MSTADTPTMYMQSLSGNPADLIVNRSWGNALEQTPSINRVSNRFIFLHSLSYKSERVVENVENKLRVKQNEKVW